MAMAEKDTQPMTQNTQESQNLSSLNDSPSWGLLFWTEYLDRETEKMRHGKDLYTVGRGVASDIVISQEVSKVSIDNLSRVHCGFRRIVDIAAGYQTLLEDYSCNGTYVNGTKVGKGRSKVLAHSDQISLSCRHKKLFTFLDTEYRHPSFPADISKKYIIAHALGKGSFGEVWLAIHKHSNQRYAIKSVRHQGKHVEGGHNALEQLKNEAGLLCTLNHPCIVRVEEIICRSNSLHLILELMSGGDLQAKIKSEPQLSESTAKYYFFQLVLAVEYFHKQGIVHRDLKPENILLSSREEDAILKITDFGLSKLVDENTMLKTYCGTPLYLAPEVVEAKSHTNPYTCSVDIWSLGVILFLLLSGYHPFVHAKPCDKLIVNADYVLRKERWSKVSAEGLSLVKKILQVDPKNRPSMTEILNHPWMLDSDVKARVHRVLWGNTAADESSQFTAHSVTCTERETLVEPFPKRRRV